MEYASGSIPFIAVAFGFVLPGRAPTCVEWDRQVGNARDAACRECGLHRDEGPGPSCGVLSASFSQPGSASSFAGVLQRSSRSPLCPPPGFPLQGLFCTPHSLNSLGGPPHRERSPRIAPAQCRSRGSGCPPSRPRSTEACPRGKVKMESQNASPLGPAIRV